jgi:hypothetical protein
MIPLGTNSAPAEESNPVIETLTAGRMIHSGYHWVDTSAGGLLVPEGIIHPVVNVSITGSIPLLIVHQQRYRPSDKNID